MCYKVITHTLRCDARPVISDGHGVYVDPFVAPAPCNCNAGPWALERFACADHPCCMRIEKMVRCTNAAHCTLLQYHRYEQRRCRNVWGTVYGEIFSRNESYIAPTWPHIPTFDIGTNLPSGEMSRTIPVESYTFLSARLNVITTGRLIATMIVTSDQAKNRLASLRERHDTHHGPCKRVLNPWECEEIGPIQELAGVVQEMAATLARQMNLFRANMEFYQEVRVSERRNEDILGLDLDFMVDELTEDRSRSPDSDFSFHFELTPPTPPTPSDTDLLFCPETFDTVMSDLFCNEDIIDDVLTLISDEAETFLNQYCDSLVDEIKQLRGQIRSPRGDPAEEAMNSSLWRRIDEASDDLLDLENELLEGDCTIFGVPEFWVPFPLEYMGGG